MKKDLIEIINKFDNEKDKRILKMIKMFILGLKE